MKLNLNVHSIKKQPDSKYIIIYELRAKKLDGEVVISERCLSLETAEKSLKIAQDCFVGSIYSSVWIMEQICWL